MPLSKLQIDILRLLASHRSPESFVGGSTPLNRNTLRHSGDIDIFHDCEELVREAADSRGDGSPKGRSYSLPTQMLTR